MTTDVTTTLKQTKHRIGRLRSGESLAVEFEIEALERHPISTHHVQVKGGTRFSITGCTWERGARDPSRMGQIADALLKIEEYAPGWTEADVRSLHDIWERWHLNDMRAECAHMDLATLARESDGYGGERIACGESNLCKSSGYTYGASWLYEALPEKVVDEIVRLSFLPIGRLPSWF